LSFAQAEVDAPGVAARSNISSAISSQGYTFGAWIIVTTVIVAYITFKVAQALVPPIKALRRFFALILADDLTPDINEIEEASSSDLQKLHDSFRFDFLPRNVG
jgi:hypothetical protein